MKDETYWQARAEKRLIEAEQEALKLEKRLKQAFDQAYQAIELQIYKLYGKYATDNQLDYADAMQYLTNDELEAFQRDLAFYLAKAQDETYREEHRAYLQALSTRARVKRLEEYQARLTIIAEELYTETVIPAATNTFVSVVQDSYLKTAFDMSQALSIAVAFNQPSVTLIDEISAYPWSGKDFSTKWQNNCTNFEAVLNETLTKGLITGASNQAMARELRDKTDASYDRALRLVRTETNYAHNQATASMYEQLGVEQYKYLATLDIKTSSVCRAMDSKIIDLADKIVGINYPPLHPWCRSTTIPVLYDDIGTRVARTKDGKTIKVPSNMTYEQWHKQYVASDPEYAKYEKMYKNRHADKKQYERYQEAFKGTGMLKSFDEFVNLKYNNLRGYTALKEQYRLENGRYKGYAYNKDGTIRVTDDLKGSSHAAIPKIFKPYAVIENIEIKGNYRQINRTIYDENSRMVKQIHGGYHNNAKRHPYGKHGEHGHDYKWQGDAIKERTTRDLNDDELNQNKDIVKGR